MGAPSQGTVTIYKELISEVNSALPKRKGGTGAPPDYFLTSFRQPLPRVLLLPRNQETPGQRLVPRRGHRRRAASLFERRAQVNLAIKLLRPVSAISPFPVKSA